MPFKSCSPNYRISVSYIIKNNAVIIEQLDLYDVQEKIEQSSQ